MITKDGRDTPLENLTPENYVVPRGEERSYHAVIEVRQHDSKTGKKISVPRIQKFGRKMFEQSVWDSLIKQGYTVTILHNPNEWIKKNEAEKAKKKAEEAAKRKAEEDAEFDRRVAAKVAEEVKKLKAEFKAEQKKEK